MGGNPRNPAMSQAEGTSGLMEESPEPEGLVAGGARAPKGQLPDPKAR